MARRSFLGLWGPAWSKTGPTGLRDNTSYLAFNVDHAQRSVTIFTGNREFFGWGNQVREGSTPDGWRVRWERRDVGTTTGEGFLPRHIWGWLCDATDKVKEE